MAFTKLDPSDGLYRETSSGDGTEPLSTNLPALYDGNKSVPASPTDAYWYYKYAYALDLGIVRSLSKLICYDNLANDNWYSTLCGTVQVFWSNDNVTYTFLQEFIEPTRVAAVWELLLSTPKSARYFKVWNPAASSTLADSVGASMKVTEIEAYTEIVAKLSGTVKEKEIAVQRIVRAYIRSTGQLFDSITSNPDGTFELNAPDTSTLMIVIAIDDTPGNQYNALIFDRVTGYIP